MYKFSISIFLLLIVRLATAQTEAEKVENDSISYKTVYGFRIGVDISKPIRANLQDYYNGLEFVLDYRLNKTMYLATEFGTEKHRFNEDFFTATGEGTYARLGMNFNTYENWLDMNNEIFIGMRYGFSFFNQILEDFTINNINSIFPPQKNNNSRTDNSLNAHWGELMIGIKAEIAKNVFMGISGSYKLMFSITDPKNFKSIFSPGFNRVYESNTGFGFNYTISYLISFKRK